MVARLALPLALAAAPVLDVGPTAAARPLTVEDLLQREAFGGVTTAPGGRWLLVEQRGPLATGARFDFGSFNASFRTRLMAADLTGARPLSPLFAPEAGVGYRAGPISPDGERVVVYRLTETRWELGVARFATGEVVWTGLTPEVPGLNRTVQWTSATTLMAVLLRPGAWPFALRAQRPQAASPALWATTAQGGTAVVAVGSGRHLAERPSAPPRRLATVSALTGKAEVLAEGDLFDLEVSPDGRTVALLEAGADIPLQAGRPVQGPYGIAVRRTRLRLLDLATRQLTTPCPACDVLASLVHWSPDSDALLIYARSDGAAWPDGGLLRIDRGDGRFERVGVGLQPALDTRPERVAAGWFGGDPILFGRPPGGTRDDWFRLTANGPVSLTRGLANPSRTVIVGPSHLLTAADGSAWRLDRDGRVRRLSQGRFTPLPRRDEDIPPRTTDGAVNSDALAGVETDADGSRVRRFLAKGGTDASVAANAGRPFAAAARGTVLDFVEGGGAERLVWRPVGGTDIALAEINGRLAAVTRPAPIPIRHAGPDGRPLTSWLFAPPAGSGPPPPLVVVPYPGAVYASPPERLWSDAPIAPAAALVGRGYAVLLPSLPTPASADGPAEDLAARVLAIVDAAATQPLTSGRFDPTRLALWGHSFGGYAVAAIVAQSDRFKAGVAVAPTSDLASVHGQFGPARRVFADEGVTTPWSAGWTETLQGGMGVPPWEAPDRYRRNSPLMAAGRIHTPLLLAYGEIDGSHPGQAEELFSALYRQGKDAVLLAYWGEPHLFGSPGNLRDLYARGFAFLDQHLGASPGPTADSAPPQGRPALAFASSAPRLPRLPPPRGPRRPGC